MEEIFEMLQDLGGGCYSHYFLANKGTGGFCPILSFSRLNACCQFRMENLISQKKSVSLGYYEGLVDLRDAYLHVPIHPYHWWYLLRLPPGTQ